jgi:crotonobetainyl-CoA:carnitine CoA-transferase CaiB-like acyl-CoA transferase
VTGVREGEPGAGPQRVGVAVTDVMTGMYAVSGVLAALFSRMQTGQGQHIDLALLDVQVASMINIAQAYLSAGVVAGRNGNAHPSVVPSQAFRCADGMLMLAAGNDTQFARLCDVLERPDLARDERFSSNEARVRNREAIISTLQDLLVQQPIAVWTEKLSNVGVPCGPINDIAAVFDDPQVQHRAMRVELEHSRIGRLPVVGSPLKLSHTAVAYGLAPPLLGEHTDAVMSELLGLTTDELTRLREAGVL